MKTMRVVCLALPLALVVATAGVAASGPKMKPLKVKVSVRAEDFGPRWHITLIGVPSPNVVVIFNVRL